ncbi:MAG: tail fiber domain-containing protein [Bacteroidia bacterium]|nr:tail fiber domain-containing protein [Bacteroidia bacterium]
MKKLLLTLLGLSGITPGLFAQSTTVGNSWASGYFLGYSTAGDLDFRTNNTFRMRINQNIVYPPYVGAGNIAANGFVGINTMTPWTQLHISGNSGTGNGTGWRRWMRTGVYMNHESNNLYVGMRELDATELASGMRSDAVVSWGDDEGPGNLPTRLRFIFTRTIGIQPTLDREVALFTAAGRMGLGDFITPTTPIAPQQQLHIHDGGNSNNIQISNNSSGAGLTDGFVLGNNNSVARLANNENHMFQFLTSLNTGTGANNERMRITQIGALGPSDPTNPFGFAKDFTRIGITHDPDFPLTRPLALLHMGDNTLSATGVGLDGVRSWMDVGILVTKASDHVFLGLKPNAAVTGVHDAVLSWGDNQLPISGFGGPDNLRFIFTSTTGTGSGTPPSTGTDGVEVARFVPGMLNTVSNPAIINKPSLGIGDFSTISPTANNYVGATLDVDGDTRIRTVSQDNTLTQILVRNPNDFGRLHWRDITTISGTVTADNGCSIDPNLANNVQLGYLTGGTPSGLFTGNRTIAMNNFDLLFQGINSPGNNLISFGVSNPNSGTDQSSKMYLINNVENAGALFNTNAGNLSWQNIFSGATGLEGRVFNVGANVPMATGLFGLGNGQQAAQGAAMRMVHGTYGYALGDMQNFIEPVGARGYARSPSSAVRVMGGLFQADSPNAECYGVYAEVLPGNTNPLSYAGFFAGGTSWLQTVNFPSDSSLKTNIAPITNALDILKNINVYSYNYKSAMLPQANFDDRTHYGVLSQEVEITLPELVKEGLYRATLDSLLDTVYKPRLVKGVNYIEFVPILIGAVKSLQDSIAVQDSLIDSLSARVTQMQTDIANLYTLIAGCCSQPRPDGDVQQQEISEIDVELSNTYMVVLDQNVPNPFAENTSIQFHIPAEIRQAQMMFTDMNGKVIKMLSIPDRGWGRVNVYADDLSTGIYTYSLILDGKVYATKRMVKN